MTLLLASLLILGAGAGASAVLAARPRWAKLVFLASLGGGCSLGLLQVLLAPPSGASPIRSAWRAPMGEWVLAVDPLSTFFLLVVFAVCLAAGVFGEAYVARSRALAADPSIRPFFLLLTAALATVVCAGSAVLFLLAWELMALASFFLIMSGHDAAARRAALLYMICTHTGTLALFLLFAVLGDAAGTLDFEGIRAAAPLGGRASALALPLGLIGFGMKAGMAPLHVWLQEAHPAAPSHVSALMSGVVIKMGVYGILRLLSLGVGAPESWAVCLIAVGAVSGIGGVLFALAQHDLKRLLAYHSVENIGIIALGMGLGCLGLARQRPELAVLGFTGAILHCLNHGLFKALLFLGSGAFYQALGTRDIEGAGGLLRRMPWTSALSLVGAAAICGIPPLNGFVSEWLIYLAAFRPGSVADARLAAAVAASLALIGGLAIACFTKANGALCLGEPRTAQAAGARDPEPLMLVPMGALAAACAAIGLWPRPFALLAGRAAAAVCGAPPERLDSLLGAAVGDVRFVGLLAAAVVAGTAALAAWRAWLLGGRIEAGPTWGCGFSAATTRMQYSASSFAQPLLRFFEPVLGSRAHARAPEGYWPAGGSFSSHTSDPVLDRVLLPGAAHVQAALAWMKRSWRGRLQYYMLYVSIFLIAILFWKL
ncbi:MAG: oxidoreductase [Elusimicrobia bacterium]|nr:oxidoreductase [Elusimicrobiota bacterium]